MSISVRCIYRAAYIDAKKLEKIGDKNQSKYKFIS